MNRLSKRLLNLFLISGICFFVLISLMFAVTQIWPVIWDEWTEYKRGASLRTAKVKAIRIIRNDFYNQSYSDSLEKVSEHAWLDARIKDPMLSPNAASDYELELRASQYSLQFVDLKDSLVYLKLHQFDPGATVAPVSIDASVDEAFPGDIIDDSLQLQLCYKDSIISRFSPFVLRSSLEIGEGFKDGVDKSVKLYSEDRKIVLYLNFELQ